MLLTQPTDAARFRTLAEVESALALTPQPTAAATDVALTVHDDIGAVAEEWRAFEHEADCTAFQACAWHEAWQTHIGDAAGVRPAIVAGRRHGRLLFIMPLAVEPGRFARRLVWHASDLCDYNTPLLAHDFARAIDGPTFAALFADVCRDIAARPGLAFDAIDLTKMPETVGDQLNPFMALATTLNPSGAHTTRLAASWDDFYTAKRSSATRRRDRTKRKRLAGLGEVRFVTADTPADIAATLDTLIAQKSQAFNKMGVPDLFAKPGHRAFFHAVATDPSARDLIHVSRLDVGHTPAAANLGLVLGGAYYHMLASYDAGAVSRFGPGAAHLQDLMAYAIDRGCHTFDFTIGDERYKREWSDRALLLHDHRSAATLKGWVTTLPAEAVARVKRVLKQTPFLWQAVRSGRAMVAGLRGRGGDSKPMASDDES
jgi:CelD/BcsL family acetyltransferase involved in cellulose biosynthesis